MPFEILEGPDGQPVTAKADADGNLMVTAVMGGGPSGGATEAEQQVQTARLVEIRDGIASVYAEVAGVAKDASIQATTSAIVALGGGGTVAQVVSALASDAATQSTILSRLTSINSTLATNLDTPLSGLLTQLQSIATSSSSSAASLTSLAALISAGSLKVAQQGPVPAGTNVIGHVIVDAASNVAITTSLPAGTAQIGHVVVDSGSALAVASLPSIPAGSALIGKIEATAVGGGALATEATLAAIQTLLSGTITITGTVSVSGPVAVTGTFFQATQPVSIASTVNVETELSATGPLATDASVDQVETKLGTQVAQESTTAKDASVDGLEALIAATNALLATLASQTINTELSPQWMRGPEDGFGRNVVVNPTPVIQSMFANGITIDIWKTYTTGTGTATSTAQTDSLATVSTGATGTSIAELTSTDTFSYRAGQSVRMLFTTLFSAPASGGFQAVGCGSNDGIAVGYNGTAFGFLIRRGGVSEVRTITITTASTTNQNVTVTLNGVGTSVAVTNSGNTVTTARELAAGDYSASGNGWDAYQFGSTVIFVSRQPGPLSGTYSLTATTAVGSFAQTLAGVTPTDTWYAKTAWTHDRLDGATGANNRSGATIDPTKLSVWQAIVPYLGAGPVILQWQDPTTFRWTTCHVVAPANTATTPTVRNPMFRLWIRASGASNISTSSASMAMFCDGVVEPIGPRVAIPPSFKTTVGNASELPLVAVRTERIFNGSKNRAPFRPVEVAVSAGATGQVILRFYLNPTLTGANFGTVNGLHPLSYDTSATAISGGLLVGTIITSPSGGSTPIPLLDLGYSLQPGDVVGISAQQTSGTNGTVAIGLTGILDNGCGGI